MNCPFHVGVYKQGFYSYRDLPLRWAELGTGGWTGSRGQGQWRRSRGSGCGALVQQELRGAAAGCTESCRASIRPCPPAVSRPRDLMPAHRKSHSRRTTN